MTRSKKTRKHLNGAEIRALILEKNQGINIRASIIKYDISRSTYYRVLADGEPFVSPNQKRNQKAKYDKLNERVYEWYADIRERGYPVAGPAIKLIAKYVQKELINDPTTSQEDKSMYLRAQFGNSWLEKFKKTHAMRKLRVNGERASVSADVWLLMQPLIDEIDALNLPNSSIYNWDETGIFYRALPKYTLAGLNDNGAGAKEDKKRITALICVNADGSDNSVVLIGKSKKPAKTSPEYWAQLGIDYYSNDTAWMNLHIFNKLLQEFDDRCYSPTVLILDNFSGHKVLETTILSNVIPIYLPPNTTSVTQALDAGIIASFKINYRSKLMAYICSRIADNSQMFTMNEINIHRIGPWIKESIDMLNPLSIQKCFYRTLKLESLRPQTNDQIMEESGLDLLTERMETLLDRSIQVEEAIGFALGGFRENTPNATQVSQNAIEDHTEDVIIPDLKTVLKQFELIELYCENTGLFQQVEALQTVKVKIEEHLLFE